MVLVIENLLILLIGLFSGAYGIMVGAGGGFILVPALLLLLQMPPEIAAGTGLVVVLINAVSGVSGFIKQKRIDYQLSLLIIIGAIPGSFIGVNLAQRVPVELFYGAFATVLLLLGGLLFVKNSGKNLSAGINTSVELSTAQRGSLLLVGVMIGTVSTFFGIGGGWLMVPILIFIYRISPHRATATSIFALCLYSIIGVILHVYSGHVDWQVAMWAGAGALLGAQAGVFISNRVSGKLIVQLLSILLVVIGIRLLV